MAKIATPESFALELRDFNKIAKKDATKALRRVGLKAVEDIVVRTPVLTGCARANWRVSFGALSREVDLNARDVNGAATITKAQAKISSAELGTAVYIENSVPYIQALENGWSRQAAQGMVEITCRELQAALDAGAR